MSKVGPEGRSFLPIELPDLQRLGEIARIDRETFFREKPIWNDLYADKVFGIALCQGAAKHNIDKVTGINDFDVYTFYKTNPAKPWYAKRIKCYDFGDPKFGQSTDKPRFIGRRVDCLGREIEAEAGEDFVSALRRYLESGRTETARLLAGKAVVAIEPYCGNVIWPVGGGQHD